MVNWSSSVVHPIVVKDDGIHIYPNNMTDVATYGTTFLLLKGKPVLRRGFDSVMEAYVPFTIDQLIQVASRSRDRLNIMTARSRRDRYADEDREDEKPWLTMPESVFGSVLGFI
jgi:hypothetical protein